MTEYETLIQSVVVMPKGARIFDDRATHITLADEGGGAFVEIRQPGGNTTRLDPEEWEQVRVQIGVMMGRATEYNDARADK